MNKAKNEPVPKILEKSLISPEPVFSVSIKKVKHPTPKANEIRKNSETEIIVATRHPYLNVYWNVPRNLAHRQ